VVTRRASDAGRRARPKVAAAFAAAPPELVAELPETLVTLGQARQTDEGRHAAG
jgi:hypothetical protein